MPKPVNAAVTVTEDVPLMLALARLKRYVVASGVLLDGPTSFCRAACAAA